MGSVDEEGLRQLATELARISDKLRKSALASGWVRQRGSLQSMTLERA